MKKIRILALLLTVLMLMSMVPITASASGGETDNIIIDFRKETYVPVSGFSLYKHSPTVYEPDPLLGGKYSFDAENQAIKLEYSPCEHQNDYRLMLRTPNNKNILGSKKFAVIVYMAKTDADYRLNVWNTPKVGDEAVFTAAGKDTAGKFVISEPVNIEGTTADNTYARWNRGGINTVNFITSDTDAEFYIKEIGFFNSAADAKAYYATADLSKPAAYNASPIVKFDIAQTESFVVEGEPTGDPKVMKFASKDALRFSLANLYVHGDNHTEGKYEFTEIEGRKAIHIMYLPHNQYPYITYRCMPKFSSAGIVNEDYKYVRVTYLANITAPAPLVFQNNASHEKITLVSDASVSNGEWVISPAVRIDQTAILTRFTEGRHNMIGLDAAGNIGDLYIAEVAFFTTEAQAYEYYGDSKGDVAQTYVYDSLEYGYGGNGSILSGETYGNNRINTANGSVDISYAVETNAGVSYMAKVKFNNTQWYSADNKYVRVLYSAKNPEGVEGASLLMRNDKTHEVVCLKANLTDTDGYVLSDVTRITDDMADRFDGVGDYDSPLHNSVIVNHVREGGEYSIKALYFFPSRDAALSFSLGGDHAVTVNGTDISSFTVIHSEGAPENVKSAAKSVASHISFLTGKTVAVKSDASAETKHEILIGSTNRDISLKKLSDAQAKEYHEKRTVAGVYGDKIVINTTAAPLIDRAVKDFLTLYLYKGKTGAPDVIALDDSCVTVNIGAALTYDGSWYTPEDAAAPEVVRVDFSSDEGYFTAKNGNDNWKYENGSYNVNFKGESVAYVHVYEKNVDVSAKLTAKSDKGFFGVIARYCSDHAFVKAGYDFKNGEWYIESREGFNFDLVRAAKLSAKLDTNRAYEIKLTLRGEEAVLYVDGKELISAKVSHLSPGRLGLYAKETAVSADDFEAVLVSGEGTVFTNVEYTLIPEDRYLEGGTVIEMSDGSLVYTAYYDNFITYRSNDNGKTWIKSEMWTNTYQYPNVLRLENGDIIKIMTENRNGKNYKTSQTSSDDGKTWKVGGIICGAMYENATAVNMNDKVTQSGTTGRIFYCQNYEVLSGEAVDGRMVFCEFYYSDDNGMTWFKSDTDSWELGGNEDQAYFGECKILECADGTLRMYNSWNFYGCVVYSESKDNGKTWGPLIEIPELTCTRSSMQFFRDPYADNDTTYYMVWINTVQLQESNPMPRSRLSLAYTEDGKNWEFIGDIWRWESNWKTSAGSHINHIVDPFVTVTEDYLYVGTGASEKTPHAGDNNYHQAQRQHIWAIPKASLPEGKQLTVRENLGSFTDVTTHDDFYEGVKFAVDNGLFNGTSATAFEPNTVMNRAMFVTVLGRLDKADVSRYTVPTFSDVKAGQWYTSYVEWAAANGIVNGLGNGVYGISNAVTIEQACTILYRYNGGKAGILEGKTLADFADTSSVSSWAADAVKWAVENGIYEGFGGELHPTDSASRAVVAMMFANYVKAFG